VIAASPLALVPPPYMRTLHAVCRKRSTAIGENEFGCDFFRRRIAICSATTRHIRCRARWPRLCRRHRSRPSAIRSATSARPPLTAGIAEAGQFGRSPETTCLQPGNDGVETRPIDSSECSRTALAVAELRRIDRAVGEKPIPLPSLFQVQGCKVEMPMRKRCVWALIDKSNFSQFKALSLT